MIGFTAHFDGKVLVPDEPIDLKPNQKVRVTVEPDDVSAELTEPTPKPKRILGQQRDLVVYMAPDWADPLPDDFWDHNKDDEANP